MNVIASQGWSRLWLAMTFFLIFFTATQAQAALTFTLITGDDATNTQSMVFDSNKCPAEGPQAMYVAGKITNTGVSAEYDVEASLTGLTGSFALAGSQSATQFVGRMDPGGSQLVGWYIEYTCADGASTTPTISVTSSSGGFATSMPTLTQRSAISANAGGQIQSTLLGPGAVVGQIIEADIIYEFGNNSVGDEYFLQPAGNVDFDASCLQLVGSEILSSDLSSITVGTLNQLYFVNAVKQNGSGFAVGVRFFFRYLCAGVVTSADPYSAQTSGNTNIKYSSNFAGTLAFDFVAATVPFTIAKSSNPSAFIEGTGPHTTTYSVTVSNPSTFDVVVNSITDLLPAGVTYLAIAVSSDVTATNSNAVPAANATGTLLFEGIPGSSYSLVAGGSFTLVYTADVADAEGSYTNTVQATIGAETIGPASTTVSVGGPIILSVTKSVEVYDPNGLGLKAIPGSEIVYTITVANLGAGEADLNSLFIEDAMPANISFYNGDFDDAVPGSGPVNFIAGSSALTCCTISDVAYSDSVGAPAVYGYVPMSGHDSAVTFVRFNPKGTMAATSSFQVQFRALLQ